MFNDHNNNIFTKSISNTNSIYTYWFGKKKAGIFLTATNEPLTSAFEISTISFYLFILIQLFQ